MAIYKGTVIATVPLNIRSGPGTSYTDVGDLKLGDKVEASEIIGGWWKLTRIVRSGLPLPVPPDGHASSGNGAYIKTDAVLTEPTTTPTIKHTVEVYSDGSLKVDGNLIS